MAENKDVNRTLAVHEAIAQKLKQGSTDTASNMRIDILVADVVKVAEDSKKIPDDEKALEAIRAGRGFQVINSNTDITDDRLLQILHEAQEKLKNP